MKQVILSIINNIRKGKEMPILTNLKESDRLREDLGLTSFDLAELTVHIEDEFDIDIFEDGLVSTVGEIFAKLEK
jgi:acyl carrier protein